MAKQEHNGTTFSWTSGRNRAFGTGRAGVNITTWTLHQRPNDILFSLNHRDRQGDVGPSFWTEQVVSKSTIPTHEDTLTSTVSRS
jgi:hypothetical protein